jgi:hypothetical protein
MKTYRLVLVISATRLFIALALPIYRATQIPGSFILWDFVILWLLPVAFLVVLLCLLPRVPPRTITLASVATIGAFAAGVLFGRVSLLELFLISLGALGIILAARSRARGSPLRPAKSNLSWKAA